VRCYLNTESCRDSVGANTITYTGPFDKPLDVGVDNLLGRSLGVDSLPETTLFPHGLKRRNRGHQAV
jgi:hypothetical protein